jgi:hypothetical protein
MKTGPKKNTRAYKKVSAYMEKKEEERLKEKAIKESTPEFIEKKAIEDRLKEQSSYVFDPEVRERIYQEEKKKAKEREKYIKQLNKVSWKPSSFLDVPEKYKRSGRVYRWCSKNREGNINKKLQEGWTIDKEIMPKMLKDGVINVPSHDDGTPKDNTFQVRELVLMWMPKNLAEARNAYYRERASVNHRREALEKELENAGSRSYGNLIEENLNKEKQHG